MEAEAMEEAMEAAAMEAEAMEEAMEAAAMEGVTAAAMEAVAVVVVAVVATALVDLEREAVGESAAERKPFPQGRSRPAQTGRDSLPTFASGLEDPNLFQGRAPT